MERIYALSILPEAKITQTYRSFSGRANGASEKKRPGWADYAEARKRRKKSMAEQNNVAKLYREFEEALVDVLTAEGELFFSRREKLRLARRRLRAHDDFTQAEYDAVVLRAEAEAWKILDL